MLAPHFKVPGIKITDIQKYTGYPKVAKLCEQIGIELYMLTATQYSPLSMDQAKRIIKEIRRRQGEKLLKQNESSTNVTG